MGRGKDEGGMMKKGDHSFVVRSKFLATIFSHRFLWYFFSFQVLWAANRSLINFLIASFYIDSADLQTLTIEFINTWLAGWFFFTVFFRANSPNFIPPDSIRKIPYEQFRMLLMFFFVFSLRNINYRILFFMRDGLTLSGITHLSLPFSVLILISVASALSLFLLERRRKSQIPITIQDPLIQGYEHQNQIAKLIENLSPAERDELCRLEQETQSTSGVTVVSLAKFIGNGIFIALLYEVLSEIFSRI